MRIHSLQQDLLGLAVLAVGSLGIGCLVNVSRPQPLPLIYTSPKDRLSEAVARVSAKSPISGRQASISDLWRSIGLDEFQDLVSTHKGIIIDARPKTIYQDGHIPGSLNLPREDFETGYARVRASLEAKKERTIVVYCSEADCQDSELVAAALNRLGYRFLFVYKEGWEEWLRAGLPQETGTSF